MDKMDQEILAILSRNCRTPVSRIAEAVHLSPQAVTARINRLEAAGVIEGYHAVLNPDAIGQKIKAIVNITIKPSTKPEFIQFVKAQPYVQECHHVTGAFSMVLIFVCPDMRHLNDFVSQVQRFGNTQTLLVLSSPISHRYGYEADI